MLFLNQDDSLQDVLRTFVELCQAAGQFHNEMIVEVEVSGQPDADRGPFYVGKYVFPNGVVEDIKAIFEDERRDCWHILQFQLEICA